MLGPISARPYRNLITYYGYNNILVWNTSGIYISENYCFRFSNLRELREKDKDFRCMICCNFTIHSVVKWHPVKVLEVCYIQMIYFSLMNADSKLIKTFYRWKAREKTIACDLICCCTFRAAIITGKFLIFIHHLCFCLHREHYSYFSFIIFIYAGVKDRHNMHD